MLQKLSNYLNRKVYDYEIHRGQLRCYFNQENSKSTVINTETFLKWLESLKMTEQKALIKLSKFLKAPIYKYEKMSDLCLRCYLSEDLSTHTDILLEAFGDWMSWQVDTPFEEYENWEKEINKGGKR